MPFTPDVHPDSNSSASARAIALQQSVFENPDIDRPQQIQGLIRRPGWCQQCGNHTEYHEADGTGCSTCSPASIVRRGKTPEQTRQANADRAALASAAARAVIDERAAARRDERKRRIEGLG